MWLLTPSLCLPPSPPKPSKLSLGFSGYKPSFVCPLEHQAQPWCHGYLKGFNWPTIITHSFKNSLHWKKYFSVAHLGYPHSSRFLNLPIQTEHGPTLPGFSFWLFSPESISSLLFADSGEQWHPLYVCPVKAIPCHYCLNVGSLDCILGWVMATIFYWYFWETEN